MANFYHEAAIANLKGQYSIDLTSPTILGGRIFLTMRPPSSSLVRRPLTPNPSNEHTMQYEIARVWKHAVVSSKSCHDSTCRRVTAENQERSGIAATDIVITLLKGDAANIPKALV